MLIKRPYDQICNHPTFLGCPIMWMTLLDNPVLFTDPFYMIWMQQQTCWPDLHCFMSMLYRSMRWKPSHRGFRITWFSKTKKECPSRHPSIHYRPLIRGRVAGAAAWAGTPRLPSPQTLPPALPGGSQGDPKVFLGVSSRRDMPGTPPEGGVPGASETDAWATSAGSSRCEGAAVLLRAPPGWQSSSPYL